MSAEPEDKLALFKFAGLALLFVLLGGGGGMLAARLLAPPMITAPIPVVKAPTNTVPANTPPEESAAPEEVVPVQSPVRLWVQTSPTANDVRTEQWAYALSKGINRFVVPLDLSLATLDVASAFAMMGDYAELHPEVAFDLALKLVPDDENGTAPYLSTAWLEQVEGHFTTLASLLAEGGITCSRLILLGNSHQGWEWNLGNGPLPDEVEASFTAWLQHRYENDEALQQRWGLPEITVQDYPMAALREFCRNADKAGRLVASAAERDLHRFEGIVLSDMIARLAGALQRATDYGAPVFTPSGLPLEHGPFHGGTPDLSLLMESTLDGFLLPLTDRDRGLGGVGGPAIPVDSLVYHGKEWALLEDTRTGIGFNAGTQKFERLKGIRPEDIFNVQRRNAIVATLAGGAPIWSDIQGEGAYIDDAQWESFAGLERALHELRFASEGPLDEEGAEDPTPKRAATNPDLMVLYDDQALGALAVNEAQRTQLVAALRDISMEAGVSVVHCLLQDFLENRTEEAEVYLFVNTLVLNESERREIHARLAREQASAIWHYGAGLVKDDADVANIEGLVRMTVGELPEGGTAGSTYALGGSAWLSKGTPVGEATAWPRLFYIDDEDCDEICRYTESDQVSAAIRTVDEGWTSVYVAEPGFTVALLREVLHILDVPSLLAPVSPEKSIMLQRQGPYVVLHARNAGEYILDLDAVYTVKDLLDPAVGWPQANSLALKLKAGETRLLYLGDL